MSRISCSAMMRMAVKKEEMPEGRSCCKGLKEIWVETQPIEAREAAERRRCRVEV